MFAPDCPLRLLAWHGFWGGGEDFAELRRWATAAGVDLPWVSPDLPGHGPRVGQSCGVVPSRSFPEQVECFAEEIERHFCSSGQRTILLGYSMGGRLALATALRANPAALGGLVLISTSPGLSDPEAACQRARVDDQFAARLADPAVPLQDLLTEFWSRPVFRSPHWPPLPTSDWVQRRLQSDRQALATALRLWSVGRQPNLWPHLSRLMLPVLLVHGAYDRKFSAIHERMATLLPHGQSVMLPECGHVALAEQPAYLAKVLFPHGKLPFSAERFPA